ncbi:ImmA/IrrE family metallo-endopeptidase [Pseudonocardia sp. RS010]|uniref:ImmA/IrrE family metallo-endopeptidase n=1 Tax=Pseudonocardia sp. RS010 TaxID=3385979 RepID=UPI0039A21A73
MRQVVAEERAEQHLGDRDRLNPYALAALHGVDVYPIDELVDEHCSDDAVQHFLSTRQSAWSAALVPLGSARVILENTSHSLQRRRASIAHELGHFLLEHGFDDVLLTDDGCRQFDPTVETQAKFFSGELLVPEKGAQWAAFRGWNDEQVAEHFNVSVQFARWRMSGARVMARRALQRQAAR